MHLHLDFETRSLLDLTEVGADVYARHPSTIVMACGWAVADEPVQISPMGAAPPGAIVDHVRNGHTVVAHNASFEWLIWNYCWRRDFPDLPVLEISQMECTAVAAYTMGLPGSLEKAALALGISKQKDMKGKAAMLYLTNPRKVTDEEVIWGDDPEKFQRMYQYCAQDVEVERALHRLLLPLSKSERILWEIDHRINQRGVHVDLSAAVQAADIVSFETERFDQKMREVTGNEVATCASNAQLTAWIRGFGIDTEGVSKSDVTDLLETETIPETVRTALQIRKEASKSSTKKLITLIKKTCSDSRIRSTLQFHGAGTGRWAGRGVQLYNLPRQKLKQFEIEGVFGVLGEEKNTA